jgi:hypothetical protein
MIKSEEEKKGRSSSKGAEEECEYLYSFLFKAILLTALRSDRQKT